MTGTSDNKSLMGIIALVSLLIGIHLPGCSTQQAYPGAARPTTEVAELHAPSGFTVWSDNPGLFKLDGELLKKANVTTLQLLPGRHTVQMTCTRRLSSIFTPIPISGPIDFSVEAAGQYQAYCDVTDDKNYFWIEDIATGEVVGGEKP